MVSAPNGLAMKVAPSGISSGPGRLVPDAKARSRALTTTVPLPLTRDARRDPWRGAPMRAGRARPTRAGVGGGQVRVVPRGLGQMADRKARVMGSGGFETRFICNIVVPRRLRCR